MVQYTHETEELINAANKLAEGFSKSKIYSDYMLYKEQIKNNPELFANLMEFKHIQQALEYKRSHSGISFEEERHLSRLYSELTLNEQAAGFLACESALLNLYKQTVDTIHAAFELD
jgi:cell fate (sporulation/competence/biofilm development) regulator YlbF (YheA/YmcA/DUF963 family)